MDILQYTLDEYQHQSLPIETSNTSFFLVRSLSYANAGPINPWLVRNMWHTQTFEIRTRLLNISRLTIKYEAQDVL